MNCIETLNYLSAFVDGEAEDAVRKEVGAHIAQCSSCRTEFELERMTKGIVRSKLISQKAPAPIRGSILQLLKTEMAKGMEGRSGVRAWFDSSFPGLGRLAIKPALAIGVIAVVAIIIVVLLGRREPGQFPAEAQPSDLVEIAAAHYASYLNGAMKLQLVSSDHEETRRYFKDKVAFDVYVPRMARAQLLGGVMCEHAGGKFVNFVYRVGGRTVLFSLACGEEIKAKGKISLSTETQSNLSQTGWHFDSSRPSCTIAVWKEKDELCSVVSDMNKEDLLALLKEEEEE